MAIEKRKRLRTRFDTSKDDLLSERRLARLHEERLRKRREALSRKRLTTPARPKEK